MGTEILVPKLGFSMTEGTLSEWLVEDGALVQEGAPLYMLEADKATQEVESPATGTLRIVVAAGTEEIEVGTVIGHIE